MKSSKVALRPLIASIHFISRYTISEPCLSDHSSGCLSSLNIAHIANWNSEAMGGNTRPLDSHILWKSCARNVQAACAQTLWL